jgi:hypothetical protein
LVRHQEEDGPLRPTPKTAKIVKSTLDRAAGRRDLRRKDMRDEWCKDKKGKKFYFQAGNRKLIQNTCR